jgi:hypothetical protein
VVELAAEGRSASREVFRGQGLLVVRESALEDREEGHRIEQGTGNENFDAATDAVGRVQRESSTSTESRARSAVLGLLIEQQQNDAGS